MAGDTGADYKLSYSLEGHVGDIKDVVSFKRGIVTASRDKNSIFWTPRERGYKLTRTLSGHTDFVCCVAIGHPGPKSAYPEGLIYTGGFDCTINAYRLDDDSSSPVFTLKGHDKPVCSLSSNNSGIIVSGSWDNRAKVWLEDRYVKTLDDHTNTVWATAFMPDGETIITGSADMTIKVWRVTIGLQSTFLGHESCIRTIAVIGRDKFLSGSNDGNIIQWNVTSGKISTFKAHDSFIYSISSTSDFQEWTSISEDGTMKVWREKEVVQIIALPMVTPWVVKYIWNGDLAVGGSDGICRIFTKFPDRIANKEEIDALNDAVRKKLAATSLATEEAIDLNTLPGPEALLRPGLQNGQKKIIKEDGGAVIYIWEQQECKWTKLGSVTGVIPKKKIFEGREYDYIIDVDVKDGEPPLKLPCNRGDDPSVVAQQFILRHNLPPCYFKDISDFITKHTQPAAPQPSVYQDPFTGTSRYIPGSVPAATAGGSSSARASDTLANYVVTEYKHQTAMNVSKVIKKLLSLNESENLMFSKEEIEALANFIAPESCTADLWMSFKNILNRWPANINFPLLDLLRIAVSHDQCMVHLKENSWLLGILVEGTSNTAWNSVSTLMAFRALGNLFRNNSDNQVVAELVESALNGFFSKFSIENHHMQEAVSICAFNYTLYLEKLRGRTESDELHNRHVPLLECLTKLLNAVNDESSVDMLCRSLCTLIDHDDVLKVIASEIPLNNRLLQLKESVQSSQTKNMIDCLCKSLQGIL